MTSKLWLLTGLMMCLPAWAHLDALTEDELRTHAGQDGVYLKGEISLNKADGTLWDTPASNDPAKWAANQRSCAPAGASAAQSCGMRISVRAKSGEDWFVVDNLKGSLSFDGLTLRTRFINSGFDNDGAAFKQDVVEVGLPSKITISDGMAQLAVANQEVWKNNTSGAAGADMSFRQTNLISVAFGGTLQTQGNLLVFAR